MDFSNIGKNIPRMVFPVVITTLVLICIYSLQNSNYAIDSTRIAEPTPVLVRTSNKADISCVDMLQGGYFLKAPDVWQPYGCSLHKYTASEFKQCLLNRSEKRHRITHIVFIGDSLSRQYYNAILSLLKGEGIKMRKFHNDEITDLPRIKLKLEYRWAIYGQDIIAFLDKWNSTYQDQPPDMFLANFAQHLLSLKMIQTDPAEEKYLSAYEGNLTIIRNKLLLHRNTTESKFILTTPNNYAAPRLAESLKFLKPLFDAKHKNDSKTIIDYYNERVERVFRGSGVETLGVFHTVVESLLNTKGSMKADGIHVLGPGQTIIRRIFINYICNAYTNLPVPRDTKLCCRK